MAICRPTRSRGKNFEPRQPALDLFDETETRERCRASRFRVPKNFLELAKLIALHADERRWALLYRLLWRLTHGEPKLLEIVDRSRRDPRLRLA